ncbi:uncharacterized protein cd34 [Archocentrus centrarchus]|uniref:uncharacterized protein cd34 n=1 Tax=Archocentrus centrarchus TaxID=63155 RepID=UPI0011E9D510|nr:uncharacterized protein LOC115783131 [Archocentrus centrarchus]
MATSMWRMNGLCRKMTGLLVLCTLLLSSVVICQDTASDSPVTAATTVPMGNTTPSHSESAPSDVGDVLTTRIMTTSTEKTINSIPETNAGTEKKTLAAEGLGRSSSAETPKLDGSETKSSSDSSVFVGILVTGLLVAIGITTGYFYFQRRSNSKGMKLTDKAFPEDQENQGGTLASVAPLNPPPETQEKPSVNGESPEAAKTEPPPPTNGHSTTKTADTEL